MGNVHVLVIREGTAIAADVFSTRELAAKAGAEYCLNVWEYGDFSGLTDDEIIEQFTEENPDVWVWIVERTIDTDSQKFIN